VSVGAGRVIANPVIAKLVTANPVMAPAATSQRDAAATRAGLKAGRPRPITRKRYLA
jgi:hypothetical protein